MSKSQKIVLCAAGFLVLGMLFYPPFHYVRYDGVEFNLGYEWIFSPPKRPESKVHGSINATTLLLQWTGILIAGGIAFFVVGSGKKSQPESTRTLSSVGPEVHAQNPAKEESSHKVLRCPHCGYTQNVPLEKIPKDATEATCPTCRTKFKFVSETSQIRHEQRNIVSASEKNVSGNGNKTFFVAMTGLIATILFGEYLDPAPYDPTMRTWMGQKLSMVVEHTCIPSVIFFLTLIASVIASVLKVKKKDLSGDIRFSTYAATIVGFLVTLTHWYGNKSIH